MRLASVALASWLVGCGGGAESIPEQLDADAGAGLDVATVDVYAAPDVAVDVPAVDLGDPLCGNGVLDEGETCDPSAGHVCRHGCDIATAPACWTIVLVGDGTCHVTCEASPVTACVGGDRCCPAGCTAATDRDCQ